MAPFFIFKGDYCPLRHSLILKNEKEKLNSSIDLKTCQDIFLKYIKLRKDSLALIEIEKILSVQPNDISALWGKAEVLRRNYKLKEAEELLNKVLSKCVDHAPSLISLSYIRYHSNCFDEALKLLRQVLNQPNLSREDKALVYMLMGSINAKRASQAGFFCKIAYGTRIRGYFEKAKIIAPELSEVHLGLGSFYLLAPKIVGGNLDKAIEELEYAVKLTPDFATPHARLAQAYKRQGNLEKYNFYIKRAKELDPQNEVLKEIK